MTASRDLIKHINALNADSEAWVAKDPENRTAGMIVDVPEHWADYDVYTPEEFDRYMLEQDYYEMYKSVYGFRPTVFMDEFSDGELLQMVDDLSEQLEAEFEDQREYLAELEELEAEWKKDCMFEDLEVAELDSASTKWDDIEEMFNADPSKKVFH